ncbi:MAG: ester cyclase [Sphingomonadales bacterium]|nr:ester cyclase [Sphingomonadales bacterium]
MHAAIAPTARLLRGFAVDFLTAHNPAAAEWIMDPDYCLSIGGHLFDGRDGSYLPATVAQLDQFPGLNVTVHDVIVGEDAVAMRFTEHGVSTRPAGAAAAWGGITLFRTSGGRLRHGWAEEDYFARKRQLKSGKCDKVLAPHQTPWDQPALPPSVETEAAIRQFLADPGALLERPGIETICSGGPAFGQVIVPDSLTVNALFTAGLRAAFHVTCEGRYAGGFPDLSQVRAGHPVTLRMAAMATVNDAGAVSHVQVSADRLGLHRSLLDLSRA